MARQIQLYDPQTGRSLILYEQPQGPIVQQQEYPPAPQQSYPPPAYYQPYYPPPAHYEHPREYAGRPRKTATTSRRPLRRPVGDSSAAVCFLFGVMLVFTAFSVPTWGGAVFCGWLSLLFFGFAMGGES